MNQRLLFLVMASGVGLSAFSCVAHAQQQKVYRVGVLSLERQGYAQLNGLRDGLKQVGYIEGKNLLLDIPRKETYDKLRPIAKTYAEKKFDVVVSIGGTATIIAKETTREIPIVFLGTSQPVQSGLVKSEARPGANITGVTNRPDLEVQGKRLEVFKEVVSALRRVTILYNARGENPGHLNSLALLQKTAPLLGIKLVEKPSKSAADIDGALASVSKDTTDGIFLICSGLFSSPLQKIATVAIEKSLAFMACEALDVAEAGALVSYDSDRYRQGLRGAWYVDRILKGAKPQELPVEAPMYFELAINLKSASQIGLTIPPNVLARADKVIK